MSSRSPIHRVAVRVMCFNEAPTVVEVIERTLHATSAAGFEVLIELIDDGSTDGSGALVRARFAADPRVVVTRHPRRRGLGAVLRRSFRPTSEHDAVALLCSDLQFAPEDLVPLLHALADADLVYASRPQRRDAWWRARISQIDARLSAWLAGASFPDVHWVRAIRAEWLRDAQFLTHSPTIDLELARHVAQGRAGSPGTLRYLALPHHPRAHGKSRMRVLPVMAQSVWDLLRLRWHRR